MVVDKPCDISTPGSRAGMAVGLIGLCVLMLIAAPGTAAAPPAPALGGDAAVAKLLTAEAELAPAPIDYGYGPGIARPGKRLARAITNAQSMSAPNVPVGTANAGTVGFYGPAIPWPIIPSSATLMPDGRVMSFGSDSKGRPGGSFLIYDIWDPARGLGTDAHLVLPNMTATEIFCGGASLLQGNGQVLLVGGDLTINGTRNYSNNHTELFNPATNTLTSAAPMQYARWYPSIVSMPSGEKVVLGGRLDPTTPAITPEVFNPTTGWRTLTGASSNAAFSYTSHNWYYPRGFVARGRRVFILAPDGSMWSLDPSGEGTLAEFATVAPPSGHDLPIVMYSPGQILAVRENAAAITIGINGTTPVIAATGSLSQHRSWSNATVLADGKVEVSGGSAVDNTLTGVAYQNETWDPVTGQWTLGAVATKPRLYHSTALLLPDGSVLTAGGGAPGPVVGLNAEIYYPPYLYLKDGSGQPARRPSIVASPGEVVLGAGFPATVGPSDRIGKVAMMRLGSVTHSSNLDQSRLQVPFTQVGSTLNISLSNVKTVMTPGHYMMFAFNLNGVPSVAAIMRVSAP
ncbi:MAG: galactose oxidase early set domain-containing protein [Alphaproteobacteria bacterium]|nr:galactose oxidase early set domain-containing protein [Alphaproteobacteria bacterium]